MGQKDIPIRIGPNDILVRAWYEAVPELTTCSRLQLLTTILESIMNGTKPVIARLRAGRVHNIVQGRAFTVKVSVKESNTQLYNWLTGLDKGIKLSTLIKSCLAEAIVVVDDSDKEWMPNYHQLIMGNLVPGDGSVVASQIQTRTEDKVSKPVIMPVPKENVVNVVPVVVEHTKSEEVPKTVQPKRASKSQFGSLGKGSNRQ